MAQLWKNNAASTLASPISVGATTIVLAAGQGARFPTISGGDYFLVTLYEKNGGGTEINYEVVKCTARTGDSLTVVRDFEGLVVASGGTSGGWAYPSAVGVNPSGVTYVELRYTAYGAGNALTKDDNLAGLTNPATARTNLGAEAASNKDASGGYAGLTLFKLNLRNAANTVTSWFTTTATAARTWTMPDKDGTVAMTSDITGTNSGTNTGDETTASIKSKLGITTLSGSNTGDQTLGSLGAEASANKNAASGYAGLDASFRHILKNAAGTVSSLFASAATVARTWTFPDKDGTVAMTSDITGTNSGTNTGDETVTSLGSKIAGATAKTTPVDADSFGMADSAASNVVKKFTWANLKAAALAYVVSVANTWSGAQTFGAAVKETKVAMGANDVNLSTANYFTKTISGTTTLTVSNVPSAGTAASFILDLTNGGSAAITWWSGMKWAGGSAPTLTAAGRDVLGFFTHDGGATWTGLVLGKDVK